MPPGNHTGRLFAVGLCGRFGPAAAPRLHRHPRRGEEYVPQPAATQGFHRCEVLAQIKGDENLKTIPTILTTSGAQADILKSYQLHANAYVSKPLQLDAFQSLVSCISEFWLTKARLPHRQAD